MTDYEIRLRKEIQSEIDEIEDLITRDVANKFCDLTNDQRLEIASLSCRYCGTLALPCNCANDE